MQQQPLAIAHIVGGHDVRLSIDNETNAAHECLIQYSVYQIAVVIRPLRMALNFGSLSRGKFAHDTSLCIARKSRKHQSGFAGFRRGTACRARPAIPRPWST